MKNLILISTLIISSCFAYGQEPPELNNARKMFDKYAVERFSRLQTIIAEAGEDSECGKLAEVTGLNQALRVGANRDSSLFLAIYDYAEYVDHKAVDPRTYILEFALGIDGLSTVQVVFSSDKEISSIDKMEFNTYLAEGLKGTALGENRVPKEVVELEYRHNQATCQFN